MENTSVVITPVVLPPVEHAPPSTQVTTNASGDRVWVWTRVFYTRYGKFTVRVEYTYMRAYMRAYLRRRYERIFRNGK